MCFTTIQGTKYNFTASQDPVLTGPGATAFTRMPFGASCCDRERVKLTMAPLVLEYLQK